MQKDGILFYFEAEIRSKWNIGIKLLLPAQGFCYFFLNRLFE
jgi:hypothetical protein